GPADARAARRPSPAADAVPAGGVQSDRRSQDRPAQLGSDLLRLSHQRTHQRAVPHQSRYPARAAAHAPRHGEPARHVRPADSRVEASLRSVEDFTEFEQRTAYFNGDQIHAIKKGMNILDRIQVSHMAQMQNMLDFPPAPKLTVLGRLDPTKATESELR